MSSWVDSGLHAARWARPPPAVIRLTRPAVSAVMCRQAATARPANGCSAVAAARTMPSTGMARSAQAIRDRPPPASPGSDMSEGEPPAASRAGTRAARLIAVPGSVAVPGSIAVPGSVPWPGSVAVVVGLVGALDRHPDVVGLLLGQGGQPGAESVEMQPGHLLIQVLGQDVHAHLVVTGAGEQLDLDRKSTRLNSSHLVISY